MKLWDRLLGRRAPAPVVKPYASFAEFRLALISTTIRFQSKRNNWSLDDHKAIEDEGRPIAADLSLDRDAFCDAVCALMKRHERGACLDGAGI